MTRLARLCRSHARTSVLATTLLVAMTAAACSSSGGSSSGGSGGDTNASGTGSSGSGGVTKIAVESYGGSRTDLPMLVASAKGFDAKHHLEVKLTPLQSGTSGTAAVVGGSLQIGASSVNNPLSADASGGNLQIVAGFLPTNIYSLISPAGSNPSQLTYPDVMHTLSGKTIGVSALGGTTDLMARTLLAGAGMNSESAKFTAVGAVNTGYAALVQHRVAAYLGYSPLPAICRVSNTCTVLVNIGAGQGPSELKALNGAFQVYYSSAPFIQSHTEDIQNFTAMVEETVAWMKDPANLSSLTAIAQKNIKLGTKDSDKVVSTMVEQSAKLFDASINRSAVTAWNDFLLSTKKIKKSVPTEQVVWEGAPKPSQ